MQITKVKLNNTKSKYKGSSKVKDKITWTGKTLISDEEKKFKHRTKTTNLTRTKKAKMSKKFFVNTLLKKLDSELDLETGKKATKVILRKAKDIK